MPRWSVVQPPSNLIVMQDMQRRTRANAFPEQVAGVTPCSTNLTGSEFCL
jgi:hypothetical protein